MFFIFVNFAAVCAAVTVFPVVYPFVTWLMPVLAKYPAEDVLNRLVILSIFISTWISYTRLEVEGIGLVKFNRQRQKIFFLSMAAGVITVCSYYAGKLFLGHGVFQWIWPSYIKFLQMALWYIIGALAVGLIEETFFRGIALQVFQNDIRTRRYAILLSALFFSTVHFLDFSSIINLLPGHYRMSTLPPDYTAATLLAKAIKFGMLFLLGIAFAHLRVRTNSLYASIGLHAGLVFMARLGGKSTAAVPGQSMIIFSQDTSNALLAAFTIGLMFLLMRYIPADFRTNKYGTYLSRN